MDQHSDPSDANIRASWKPLSRTDRRVLGVMVEKAKTTPDAYPLSLNAVRVASNQKSNRYPMMNLDEEQVDDALDRLRGVGVVAEVQSSGRVPKYRHYAKDWLGVEGAELAVMAELLLRGAQTLGELRGRAARMDPIADVAALRPLVDSLKAKGLVIGLTAEGRGHVVTHALYEPAELQKVRDQHDGGSAPSVAPPSTPAFPPTPRPEAYDAPSPASSPTVPSPTTQPPSGPSGDNSLGQMQSELAALRREVDQLREQMSKVTEEVNDLWSNIGSTQ
jgi:uncharacterized protein YceH (UPF0502 family)